MFASSAARSAHTLSIYRITGLFNVSTNYTETVNAQDNFLALRMLEDTVLHDAVQLIFDIRNRILVRNYSFRTI